MSVLSPAEWRLVKSQIFRIFGVVSFGYHPNLFFMKSFLKKHGSTLLLFVFLALVLIPQTGTPIRVFVNRLISFSPSVINEEKRALLSDYNWPLLSMDGNQLNLSQSKNKVIVLNVWATWCPPCIAEMPSLQQLYDKMQNEADFYFITYEDQSTVSRFLDKKGYELPVYFPRATAPAELESASLPTTYLIAPNGEIVIRKVGAAKWDSDKVIQEIRSLRQNESL